MSQWLWFPDIYTLVYSCCYFKVPLAGSLLNNKNVFLTIVEVEESWVKVPAFDQVRALLVLSPMKADVGRVRLTMWNQKIKGHLEEHLCIGLVTTRDIQIPYLSFKKRLRSTSNSSFLPVCTSGGRRWWSEHVGGCLLCGRPGLTSGPLVAEQ